ncbi:MAG: lipoate--protein ligase family protein [Thermoplasmatota archaeon]
MDEFRYIPPLEADVYEQMAIDEAILRSFDEGESPPTIRFYRFKPSAITLGYTQDVEETIHIKACEEHDISYVRRITGGGTVFHDYEGEITYSMITDKIEGDIEESFFTLLEPIIETLKDYDLDAKFKPYNDILVEKRKISGSAQRRGKKGMLQHGTLMYATDLEVLSEILKVDEDKLQARGAESFTDLVTTIEDEIGWKPDPGELIKDMKSSYERVLGIEAVEDELNENELEKVQDFKEKYRSDEWNDNRRW